MGNSKADGPAAILPTFMLPRTCMGVVWKHVLTSPSLTANTNDSARLLRDLRQNFPCCAEPLEDMKKSLVFWDEVHRCVTNIAEPLGADEFKKSMDAANILLQDK